MFDYNIQLSGARDAKSVGGKLRSSAKKRLLMLPFSNHTVMMAE